MSRSLVGSSRSSTLGSVSSSLQQLEAAPLATGQVAEPGGQPVAGEAEPLQHRGRGDLLPSAVLVTRRIDSTVGSTRASGSRSSSCLGEVLQRDRAAVLAPGRRRGASVAGRAATAPSVLPAPLTPTMPTRSPGPSRQVACVEQRAARRATRSTSSMSMTSLPSRWVGEPLQLQPVARRRARPRSARWRRRCGTSASTCAPAAPRRSQASSLRTRFCRRASEADGLALALGLGQHERGVPALVGVDRRRRAPPTSTGRPRRGTSGRG